MSGFPVVVALSGGIRVVNVASGAPLATVATSGLKITIVASGGIPLVVQGV
jgi:hypothetical protein